MIHRRSDNSAPSEKTRPRPKPPTIFCRYDWHALRILQVLFADRGWFALALAVRRHHTLRPDRSPQVLADVFRFGGKPTETVLLGGIALRLTPAMHMMDGYGLGLSSVNTSPYGVMCVQTSPQSSRCNDWVRRLPQRVFQQCLDFRCWVQAADAPPPHARTRCNCQTHKALLRSQDGLTCGRRHPTQRCMRDSSGPPPGACVRSVPPSVSVCSLSGWSSDAMHSPKTSEFSATLQLRVTPARVR